MSIPVISHLLVEPGRVELGLLGNVSGIHDLVVLKCPVKKSRRQLQNCLLSLNKDKYIPRPSQNHTLGLDGRTSLLAVAVAECPVCCPADSPCRETPPSAGARRKYGSRLSHRTLNPTCGVQQRDEKRCKKSHRKQDIYTNHYSGYIN